MDKLEKTAKDHISSMPGCEPQEHKISQMTKDQAWTVRGVYDYTKREGNLEKGQPSDVMAIAILLVAVPPSKHGPSEDATQQLTDNTTGTRPS